MRTLQQPGPIQPSRIDIVQGHAQELRYTLTPGLTLTDAVTRPLIEAGFQSATVVIKGAVLSPFRFVMPGPPDSDAHVAYFSAAVEPTGPVRIEQANVTFGWSSGTPLIHVHAAWTEAGGRQRGGHILPGETRIAEPTDVIAWGFSDIRVETAADPETNFSLLQPILNRNSGPAVYARVKPNQDIISAVEKIAQDAGPRNATIRGLGSLIGAAFTSGNTIEDLATEVFIQEGFIQNGQASIAVTAVDFKGAPRSGWLKRNENPVCITFDIVLTASP